MLAAIGINYIYFTTNQDMRIPKATSYASLASQPYFSACTAHMLARLLLRACAYALHCDHVHNIIVDRYVIHLLFLAHMPCDTTGYKRNEEKNYNRPRAPAFDSQVADNQHQHREDIYTGRPGKACITLCTVVNDCILKSDGILQWFFHRLSV